MFLRSDPFLCPERPLFVPPARSWRMRVTWAGKRVGHAGKVAFWNVRMECGGLGFQRLDEAASIGQIGSDPEAEETGAVFGGNRHMDTNAVQAWRVVVGVFLDDRSVLPVHHHLTFID